MAVGRTTNSMRGNIAGDLQAVAGLFASVALAGGLVQTSDTGQTSAGSLAGVNANTVAGYQIWRFNDALQATKPIYFKIEWGGGTLTYSMGIWITIGTGSNGSGTITGTLFPRTHIPTAAGSSTAYVGTSVCSASTNRLAMILGAYYATQNQTIVLGFERSKDASGNDTGDGLIYMSTTSGGANWTAQYIPFVGTARSAQGYLTVPVPAGTGSLASGNTVGFTPVLPFTMTGATNPGLNFLIYTSTDTAALNDLPVTIYGAQHTYFQIGLPFGWFGAASAVWAASALSMRYE